MSIIDTIHQFVAVNILLEAAIARDSEAQRVALAYANPDERAANLRDWFFAHRSRVAPCMPAASAAWLAASVDWLAIANATRAAAQRAAGTPNTP